MVREQLHNQFLKIRGLAVAFFVSLCSCGLNLHAFEQTVIDVPVGASEEVSERITMADGAVLGKVGGGELIVPASKLDQRAVLNLEVREGRVTFPNDDGSVPAAATLSESVQRKLAVWLSVGGAQHLVTRSAGVEDIEYWYDVRENVADFSSPRYVYAQASHLQTEAGPRLVRAKSSSYRNTVTNEMDALYFGGLGSGVSMDFFLPDGTNYKVIPNEVAAVHGVVDSWGYLFGNCDNSNEVPVLEADSGTRTMSSKYAWGHCWAPVMGDAKIWVDGVETSRGTTVHRGFHLLQRRRNTINMSSASRAQAIYSWCSKSGGSVAVWRKGGDYLSEVLYFTNTLTTAERLEVQNYLMRRWLGVRRPAISAELATNTSAEISVTSGMKTLDVAAHGEGCLVKKGAGTLFLRPTENTALRTASLSLEEGTAYLQAQMPIIVDAGDCVTASRTTTSRYYQTNAVTKASGAYADGRIVKDGNSAVTFAGIPDETTRLVVNGGSVALRTLAKSSVRYEIAVPNSGFEDWSGYSANVATIEVGTDATVAGWAQDGQYARFYNYDDWMDATGKEESSRYGTLGAKITAFGLDKARPPEGSCALFLTRQTGAAYTTVTIPEDGEYELTLWLWARLGYSENGNLRAKLTTSDGSQLIADFGLTTFISKSGSASRKEWFEYALRADVRAGTYRLYLCNEWNSEWEESNNNITLVIDDLHLYRVGDYVGEFKIPGGDFEPVGNFAKWTYSPSAMDSKYVVKGWSFDAADWLGGSSTETHPSVGVVNSWMLAEQGRGNGNGYNGGMRPLGGEYQLLFRKPNADNKAHATFTPPTGTWYLTCRAALWADYGAPKLKAKVAIGGQEVSLGAINVDASYDMKSYVWAIPFAADGSAVDLEIAYDDSGVAEYKGVSVDDVRLIAEYVNEDELLVNGDFELPAVGNSGSVSARTGWTGVSSVSGSGWNPRAYGDSLAAFGSDYASGLVFGEIYGSGAVYQDVALPCEGWYRFSFLVKGRAYWDVGVRNLVVELVELESGTTNRIGRVVEACNATYERRTMSFRINAPGNYRLCLRGTETGNSYACVDDLSLRYVGGSGERCVCLPEQLRISLNNNARLQIDGAGTNIVRHFTANGVEYHGILSKENCPQIDGDGFLNVVPNGGFIIIAF